MNDNHQRVVYYAVRPGYEQVVKIGTTNNLARRLKTLRHSYGQELQYLAAEFDPCDNPLIYKLEGDRHRQFNKSKITGEWFWVTPDLEEHIRSLPDLLEQLLP